MRDKHIVIKELQEEKQALNDKLTRLTKFLLGQMVEPKIPTRQLELLKRQEELMLAYVNVLGFRIKNLNEQS